MLYRLRDHKQNLQSNDNYTRDRVGLRSYKYVRVLIHTYKHIYQCIKIILINFVTATIFFALNVARDLPDLLAPPEPCSIKNKTDSENIELDNDNNNSNNNNNNK